MTTNDQGPQTAQKQFYKPTTHKSDFSFSSPQQEAQTVLKRALMESSRIDILRNRVQLFTDMKQNTSLVSLINKSYPKQFVEQMRTEQRVQIQKLLLQISRLHDMLEDQEKMHRHAIHRLKQESQQIALLRISNLKQSQYSQIQVIQIQLRKTKQALENKTNILEELERTSSRRIQNLVNQNQSLKADLKELVQKKNIQLHQLRSALTQQSKTQTQKHTESLSQLKSLADKQLKKILLKLQQKQHHLSHITTKYETQQKQTIKLQQQIQKQKKELNDKLQHIIQQQKQKYQYVRKNIQEFYQKQLEESQKFGILEREMFVGEIEGLMRVVKGKDEEMRRGFVFREAEKIEWKLGVKGLEEENCYLKQVIQDLKRQQLQEIQLLKVKMAVLHKSDLEALVRLYEAKIQSLTKDIQYSEKEAERMTNQLKKQRDTTYEMKKKYDYTISVLNQQIYELRVGAGNHEKQMKQKLDNQKSMMMLTSRNFIKQNQAKANNIRFYEQQLRKLRQLLEIQAQEVEQSQRNVEQKIKLAEEELSRLSNKIIQVKSEAEQSQKKLKQTIQQKNKQIKRLNSLMNNPKQTERKDDNFAKQLKRMDQQLSKKQDEIRTLKNRCQDLQSTIRTLKAQNQRMVLQNQINSQDAKKKYKTISDKNLADMKSFYDRRLQQLQHDKKELDRINSSQCQKITELIKKYQDLEESMKQLLKQCKKRGDLEMRIISLGMDNNLVKNMSELFHR